MDAHEHISAVTAMIISDELDPVFQGRIHGILRADLVDRVVGHVEAAVRLTIDEEDVPRQLAILVYSYLGQLRSLVTDPARYRTLTLARGDSQNSGLVSDAEADRIRRDILGLVALFERDVQP